MGVSFSLNDEERQWLSRLARESITTALEGRESRRPCRPRWPEGRWPNPWAPS